MKSLGLRHAVGRVTTGSRIAPTPSSPQHEVDPAHDPPVRLPAAALAAVPGGMDNEPQEVPAALSGGEVTSAPSRRSQAGLGHKGTDGVTTGTEPALEAWRRYYNEERPHSAIGNIPPIMLANLAGETSPPNLGKAENSRPKWSDAR